MNLTYISYLVKGSAMFTDCLSDKKNCFISLINVRPNQN